MACPVLFEIDVIVVVNAKMNPELTLCWLSCSLRAHEARTGG